MVKARKAIQNLYSKMVHVTCMTHRVAEEIRTNFQDINKLISSITKVFLKELYRVEIFKTILLPEFFWQLNLYSHAEEHR